MAIKTPKEFYGNSPEKSQDKQEEKITQEQAMAIYDEYRKQERINWVQSLSDEKVFRLELLQVLTNLTEAVNQLPSKILEASSQSSEESNQDNQAPIPQQQFNQTPQQQQSQQAPPVFRK